MMIAVGSFDWGWTRRLSRVYVVDGSLEIVAAKRFNDRRLIAPPSLVQNQRLFVLARGHWNPGTQHPSTEAVCKDVRCNYWLPAL